MVSCDYNEKKKQKITPPKAEPVVAEKPTSKKLRAKAEIDNRKQKTNEKKASH